MTDEPPESDEETCYWLARRNEQLRRALQNYTTHTAPALNIDSYAERVYQANHVAGL